MNQPDKRAIIVQRVEPYASTDTREIKELAETQGYTIVDEITQSKKEDSEFHIGSGKVDELFRSAVENEPNIIIFDNKLGPYQTYNIGLRMPSKIPIIDRYRLILDIFNNRASTKQGQLQVELAELRYELPRIDAKVSLAKRDEHPGFMGLGDYDETKQKDVKNRISRIQKKLKSIEREQEKRMEQRRDEGLNIIALAGYTNAGKTTLFQRLSQDLELGEDEVHNDLHKTAEVENKLFTTLQTTTRRVDIPERNALITDTAGFIADLPHWVIESFKPTLMSVYDADVILLVIDINEPVKQIRQKIVTSLDVLHGRSNTRIIPVFNKVDEISNTEIERKKEELSDMITEPVTVSAVSRENIDQLKQRINTELPPLEYKRVILPLNSDSMSVLSWIHDSASVDDVTYTKDEIIVEYKGSPVIVNKSLHKIEQLTG